MNYVFTTIKVRDLEQSLKFYKEVIGLKEVVKFEAQPGVKIVFLKDENNNKIELIEFEHMKNASDEGKSKVSIGFAVESLDNTMKLVKERDLEIVMGPVETASGERFIHIKDPNGVEINLIEGFKM
ncbi:MAG: VOC family protein [Clostridia bacterium]|nr:VOC family protein [Clostridia bacterium]